MTLASACKSSIRCFLFSLLTLLLLALASVQLALLSPSAFDIAGPSLSGVCRVAPASVNTACCSSLAVVTAARELLDGYYTTDKQYEWVPFSPALRSVPDSELGEPFDVLLLGDSLDRSMLEGICEKLPGGAVRTREKNSAPGFGLGFAEVCTSAWGNITW